MKLRMSLPEKPGWIFVVPGFDFIALLLALVLLTGVVAREGWVEIKLPPSEFRGIRMGEQNPVFVILQSTPSGPLYYLANKKVPRHQLAERIAQEAQKRETNVVGIKIDQKATASERQELINIIAGLEYRIIEGIRQVGEAGGDEP
jgi:biopolymer transport protein ExbD